MPPCPMTDLQTNRYEMHRAVLGTLDTHADAWAAVPAMQVLRDRLAAAIDTVRGLARSQARTSAPATAVKADLRDAALAEYSEVVVAEAREHLPAPEADPTTGLGAYGVTAAFVDELDALDDDFAAALSTPREAIAARKSAGRAIAVATRQAQTLLRKELDPTVDFLAPDAPAFAADYRNARIIVDRGHGPSDPDDPEMP